MIFIDLEMPVKNGHQLAKELRDMQYNSFLISLSAYNSSTKDPQIKTDFDLEIEKPIYIEVIENIFRKFISIY